ncbi:MULTISPECIES: YchJ family protein [unclassified Streptomyces]|uniref:YchJ family protein n=1 Tax=unclassified Streptomyces TaxID=2593676 RepID=UPI0036FD06C6
MSRRKPRPRKPVPAPAVTADTPCPCGLDAAYGVCCGRFHAGTAAAPTAALLMRSRYAAFVVGDTSYLLRTWAPGTRPGTLDLDPGTRWTGLEIEAATDGTAFHQQGTVTFTARYVHAGEPGSLHEHSRFTRHDGAWVYVDGDFPDA